MSAGLTRCGPAEADEVGRARGRGVPEAWRRAGTHLSRLARASTTRWTIECASAASASRRRARRRASAVARAPVPHRLRGGPRPALRHHPRVPSRATGCRSASGRPGPTRSRRSRHRRRHSRPAVPLTSVRVGDRAIVTIPGEMTVGDGPAPSRRDARARRATRSGIDARGRLRARERVHPVLHDARGVRPPALRGRLDPVRPHLGGLHRGAPDQPAGADGRRRSSARPRRGRAPQRDL